MAVKDELENMLAPLVTDLGYEYVGIDYNPHPSNGLLRIYIDEPEKGISVDDCARVSEEVSGLLDVHDPISGHYNLEVSSPGLDRPLFTPEHFARFVGEQVKLNIHAPVEGRRKFKGEILGVDGSQIRIEQDGEAVTLDHANIVKARLVPQV